MDTTIFVLSKPSLFFFNIRTPLCCVPEGRGVMWIVRSSLLCLDESHNGFGRERGTL